jgi:hypothetical protein
MSSGNEVPAPSGDTRTARASLTGKLSGHTFHWLLTAAGLTGPVVATVLRTGPPGVVGNRFLLLCQPCSIPATGTIALSDSELQQLRQGENYVNLGTAANPNGEMRGPLARR